MEQMIHREVVKQRRTNLRAVLQLSVMFMSSEVVGKGMIQDASSEGLRIESVEPVVLGMRLGVVVFFPKEHEPLMIQEAVVQWTKGTQFGVKFTKLSDKTAAKLRHFYVLGLEDRLESLTEFLTDISPPTSAVEWLRRSDQTWRQCSGRGTGKTH
ncbi:MAG: PilZ domain-containing protein [Nitrospiraceae bacterium]